MDPPPEKIIVATSGAINILNPSMVKRSWSTDIPEVLPPHGPPVIHILNIFFVR